MPAQAGDAHGPDYGLLQARLLGPFVISLGDKRAGSPRPTAKRLCELLLVSADRRISREAAYAAIFPKLNRPAASHGLSAALSYARAALAALGLDAPTVLQADRNHIWVNPRWQIEIDLELHWERLKRAMSRRQRGSSETTCFCTLWQTKVRSSRTSPMRIGRSSRGNIWKEPGKTLAWPWPETGPEGGGAARPKRWLRRGRRASHTTRRQKRRRPP